MELEHTVKYKSKRFAVRIVNLYKYLCNEKKEFVLSKQILRSGTSIGANIAESECAISRRDFLAKVYIALKECAETLYWLDLLYETEFKKNSFIVFILQKIMLQGSQINMGVMLNIR